MSPDIKSLRIEDGKLIAEMMHGDEHLLPPLGIGIPTAAIIYEGDVVATDGRRIIRYDGETVEDITERFSLR